MAVGMALTLSVATAQAELIEISWDSADGFERTLPVQPAKFVEVCGKLSKGESIKWSFTGQQPLNFNIHYHEGKKVVFPVKHDNTTSLDGTLVVQVDQAYCWMWENKGSKPAPITITLRRG
jgi:hypothetical protein